MTDDTFKISVIRTEGFKIDPASLGCYLSIDGKLYDVIMPLSEENEDNTVCIPKTGTLQLVVKAMGKQNYQHSLSLSTCLLTPDTSLWLPLENQTYQDSLPTHTYTKKF